MKRIGILGGTFNPVHIGHLAIAQTALEKCRLDKVIFVPSFRPPHKNITNLAPARARFQMTALAVKNNPLFEVSDFEIKRKKRSYTVETLKHFCTLYPKGTKLFFIIGGDSFPDLGSWKSIDDIGKMTTFVVVNRPGYTQRPKGPRPKVKTGRIKHCSVVMPGIDISSSDLRKCIRQGKSARYFMPENVLKYIQQRKLYKT